MQVNGKIQKWGNSLGIRIKKSVAQQLKIQEGTEVDIAISGNKLIITPSTPEYTLEGLLNGITRGNIHGEVDSGPATGKEEF